MRIGSFAKLCKTQISVLRHYDKIGLIKPDFIDNFTGYRYYDPEQATDFERISKFKKLGFSLKDVRKIITLCNNHSPETEKIFDDKITELELLISQIKHEKNNLLKLKLKEENQIMNNTNNNDDLNTDIININNIKFEDDPETVGKWQIIGEYDSKDYFLADKPNKSMYGEKFKEIYFLPNGQNYWIYSWTKGLIINSNGDYTAANPYKTEEINGEKYMFAEWASYDYIKRGGSKTVLVLKQLDNKKYSLSEISRTDDIDKPFVCDKKILGKWKSVAFLRNSEDYFNPDCPQQNLFFKFTEFKENGSCIRIYGEDNRSVSSPYVTWTKNFVLKNFDYPTAEKYVFKKIDGTEYLFIEWKSGDYVWGGFEPQYYVFIKN